MEGQEIIRACMLEPGDIFIYCQTTYRVRRIEKGKIHYSYFNQKYGMVYTMGAFSQEKLILITNKIKQNEHQN